MTLEAMTPIITALIAALGAGWWVRRKTAAEADKANADADKVDADALRVYVEGVYGPMIASLTTELGRSICRVEAMERQLDDLRQQIASMRTDHDAQLRARDATIHQLEDECDQLRVDLAAAQRRESALEKRVEELEAKHNGGAT